MIAILLKSKTYGENYFFIDGEDFDKIKNYTWCIANFSKRFYIVSDLCNKGNRKKILLHRLIMNCPDGMVVDHINHNGLDNRKENLRICTNQENLYNQRKKEGKTSKYKGVSFFKRDNNWTVRIRINGKSKNLGYFLNEEDAAEVYNQAALKYYGKYAFLNVVKK